MTVADRVMAAASGLERDAIASLQELVRIQSISPTYPGVDADAVRGGESEAARFVAEIHRRAGADVELFAAAPGRENCVSVVKGAGTGTGRRLLLNGHLDVVPPGDAAAWTGGDPFSGELRDGMVWGRGSADMKAGVLAQAFAARALHEAGIRLDGDLVLNAVVGEEMGEHEIGTSAALRRGPRPDVAIVAEGTSAGGMLGIAPVSPGCLMLAITVAGKSVHCGARGTTIRAGGRGTEIGVNAIDKAFLVYEALRRLEESWGIDKREELFEPGFFSLSPGVFVGGSSNVMSPAFLADTATIQYACWYSPSQPSASVKEEIDAQVDHAAAQDPWLRRNPPRVEYTLDWPPADVPADHPVVGALSEAHRRAGTAPRPEPPRVEAFRAVSDATWINALGVPAVVYGPGDVYDSQLHGVDEHVAVDEYLHAIRTFALAAISLCGLAP